MPPPGLSSSAALSGGDTSLALTNSGRYGKAIFVGRPKIEFFKWGIRGDWATATLKSYGQAAPHRLVQLELCYRFTHKT